MDRSNRDVKGVFRGLPRHGSALHELRREFARRVRDTESRDPLQKDCPLPRRLGVADLVSSISLGGGRG